MAIRMLSPEAPAPGSLGPYRVIRPLGSSAGAKLFLACEEGPAGFTREVVLKIGSAHSREGQPPGHDLAREAAIGSKLNHPNVARLFDAVEHDKGLALVLEYVDGTSLADLSSR